MQSFLHTFFDQTINGLVIGNIYALTAVGLALIFGVGNLINLAVTNGRKARPGLEAGICGEHGGDPSSIEFCHLVGLDYVSASPFRVPVARLAAAQAALRFPDAPRPKH